MSQKSSAAGRLMEGGSMESAFANAYEDGRRAAAYAGLEFPGTYYLAYRDLPEIIGRHVPGGRALDFGCGAGRSTRFLKRLGFEAVGVDISEEMLARARERDPDGDYRLVRGEDLGALEAGGYDLVLSVFPFDNIPTMEEKVRACAALRRAIAPTGRMVNLVTSPETYLHEWASFSTKDFPENRTARSGDRVRVVMLDVEDRRPVEDVLWTEEAYREVYRRAGLGVVEVCRPLGREDEGFAWVSETRIAPWTIYVLRGV